MKGKPLSRRLLIAAGALIYFFLMLPLLVVFPISLSSAPYLQFPPPGLSWQWYERYLDEAPSGAYAAEAMGRMIIVLERQQRMDQARAVAAAYLRRFPQGVYARTAREVTSR